MNGCWGRIFVSAIIALGSCTGAFAAGINTDAVNELTPDAGVTVDGVVVKDGKATGAATALSDTSGTLVTKDFAFTRKGTAHIVVETADNAVTNAANLNAAYTAAKALTPNGAALSATNRAAVLVAPGNYDLGAATFTLDADFVDFVGLSAAREDQRIYSTGHVLTQTAADIRIENLLLHYTGAAFDVNAYYPNASGVASPATTTIRNCEFRVNATLYRSMRSSVEFAGTYEDCLAGGSYCFGGISGTASGTFTNCTGGDYAFGGISGTASGTFTNCTGGFHCFGGYHGTASGTFTNCTGGNHAFGGEVGTASGTFTNCTGGNYAFGGEVGTASGGKFYHCVGGIGSFTESGTPAPVQLFCIQNGAQYSGNN